MALTDAFVRQVKATSEAGNKHADGGGMYLFVKGAAKYWRMDYRFLNKRKTLALGVYPDVSLAKAHKRRDEARELLADGIDPGQHKRDKKLEQVIAATNTFETVAHHWLAKTAANRAAITQEKVTAWLEHNVFPFIGSKPVSTIGRRDVLAAVRLIEERGAFDSAHRVKQIFDAAILIRNNWCVIDKKNPS